MQQLPQAKRALTDHWYRELSAAIRSWGLVGTVTGGRVLNMTVAHRCLTDGVSLSIADATRTKSLF
ncbi:hypothetical protein [Streptomyces sp. H39-S7]|uniref:hypothetical protein n=1 Tax=Streptomyces sp. H39-S7 TaxID=3004357 RepID=UPI0022AF28CA|nr:hypothetical protein [Streptomyces sp. H39-S7]MCZ4124944.1 hypothetical protein [Streptomyces sp. H39-S7]